MGGRLNTHTRQQALDTGAFDELDTNLDSRAASLSSLSIDAKPLYSEADINTSKVIARSGGMIAQPNQQKPV